MVKTILTTILLAMLSFAAHAADTLADMDIQISPELYAYGIDVGVKHPRAGEIYHAEAQPQFIRNEPTVTYALGDSIMALLGSHPGFVNLAVSGTTTAEILQSVSRIPSGAHGTVYVEGGFNNFAVGTQGRIVPDYSAILAALPKGLHVEVVGILPVNDAQIAPMRNATNAIIAPVDAQIAGVCHANCTVVPSPVGKSLPANLNVGDGIHPNAAGVAALKSAIH